MGVIIRQTPIIISASYTSEVPFSKKVYFAEVLFDFDDELFPNIDRPLIGSKAIYKLISDGIHEPTFSREFTLDPLSGVYNKEQGATNIITFRYDGVNYWYNINSYTDVDETPYAVGDYGLDSSVIVVATHNVVASTFRNEEDDVVVQVSVYDVISSVHYVGAGQLFYRIRLQGAPTWIESYNAKDAKWEGTCNDLGPQIFEVQVTDGVLTSDSCVSQVTFEDTNLLCS
jgi:hypothetical protein